MSLFLKASCSTFPHMPNLYLTYCQPQTMSDCAHTDAHSLWPILDGQAMSGCCIPDYTNKGGKQRIILRTCPIWKWTSQVYSLILYCHCYCKLCKGKHFWNVLSTLEDPTALFLFTVAAVTPPPRTPDWTKQLVTFLLFRVRVNGTSGRQGERRKPSLNGTTTKGIIFWGTYLVSNACTLFEQSREQTENSYCATEK